MGKIKDLTGQRFGRLVAVKAAEARSLRGEVKWLCACDCGGSTYAVSVRLSSGHTRSCGCLQKEWQSSFANHAHDLYVKKAEKIISAGQKKCSKCGHVKQMSLFPEKHNAIDGHDSWCISCFNEHYKAYRLTQKGTMAIAKQLLKQQGFEAADITTELIETKAELIKIRRKIKEMTK